MAARELIVLAMVLAIGATQSSEEEDESRLIITTDSDDSYLTSLTVGMNTLVMVTLAVVSLVIVIVTVIRLNDDAKEQPASEASPSSYSSDHAEEKTYTIHRFLERAAARYLQ